MIEQIEVEHLVVGAGVIGLAVAAAIARKNQRVFVLEAGPRAGCGISSRNSEVIHSGIYYPTNSLKHQLCVEGRRLLYAYCASRGVSYRKCGKLLVATDEREAEKIDQIARQADANGVENVEPIEGCLAKHLEPAVSAVAALYVRETGIIDSHGYLLSLIGEIEEAGGAVLLNHRLRRGRPITSNGFELEVECFGERMIVIARTLTLAAGLSTHAVGATIEGVPLTEVPPLFLAKGSYFACAQRTVFSRLIYPTPVDGGLGIHLTFDLNGRMRFGPDVEWLESSDPQNVDFSVDPTRAERFSHAIRRYWPGLPDGKLVPDYAGVRPKLAGLGAEVTDFCLHGPERHKIVGLVGLYGIESPGLTSSLAIARRVQQMLQL